VADLKRRVDAASLVLAEQGVAAGAHVGINAPNSAGFVVAVHALMRPGAVVVPLNTRLIRPSRSCSRASSTA
jgi:acyl-CoA synthetase (AMP-forming)/AMP-acid ligase II